jgi:hypothetical protein
MEDQIVTLSIKSDTLINYISDVRVYNERSGELLQIRQVESNKYSEVKLGSLSELKDSFLIVDTISSRISDIPFNVVAKVQYIINYGQKEVLRTTVESHFLDRATAFFYFRFRFCPRFPFC